MLKNKKYFLFDIDGTLGVDDILYEGSRELLGLIERIGGRSFFITNNSTKSRKDYVEKFKGWGLDTDEEQFMTASYAACMYLKKHYEGRKHFVVGTPSFEEEMKRFGLLTVDRAEPDTACVVVGFDRTLDYRKIEEACRLLFRPEVDYVATNPDLRCPVSFGFIPDCGGICEMLRVTTGRTPCFAGKPDKGIVTLCMDQVEAEKDEVLVVGDRLYTDIACGMNAGVETALVYTGEAKPGDLEDTEYKPDYVYNTIEELYQEFYRLHVRKGKRQG